MASEKRLIDAEAIARKLKNANCAECNIVRQIQCSACWVNDVLELLDSDSVDAVEVVHGRWIHTAIEDDNWGGAFHKWTCSNCDFSTGHNPNGTNYCPNCGAKMDGERKDNE